MAKVGLERMKFYAFHGYYEFERRIGKEFVLDVMIDIDIQKDPDEKISNTYNYEEIYAICKKYMKKRYQLLESLAFDIGDEIKNGDERINEVFIRIEKLNPNMGGNTGRATIEMTF